MGLRAGVSEYVGGHEVHGEPAAREHLRWWRPLCWGGALGTVMASQSWRELGTAGEGVVWLENSLGTVDAGVERLWATGDGGSGGSMKAG